VVSGSTRTARVKKGTVKETVTVEDERLRDYELVLVINPELNEEKFSAALKNVNQIITDIGGIVSDTKQWGKRKLAYPIKHFTEGNYMLIRFQLKPVLSKEVEAKLHISENVLRHLLVRLSS